ELAVLPPVEGVQHELVLQRRHRSRYRSEPLLQELDDLSGLLPANTPDLSGGGRGRHRPAPLTPGAPIVSPARGRFGSAPMPKPLRSPAIRWFHAAAAIIAPLSVHSEGCGVSSSRPRSAQASPIRVLRRLFAATPPANTTCRTW